MPSTNKTQAARLRSTAAALAANSAQSLAERSHQPFRFLDLPAEMRNLVYDFALHDTIQVTKETGSLHAQGVFPRNRESLAFAHLSREVRNEFLPLYMGHTTIRLAPEELPSYVDDHSSGEIQERVGSYTIDLAIPAARARGYCEIDLYPIFETARKSPRLVIHFVGPGNGQGDCRALMDSAIVACRRPGWKDVLILNKIYKIDLSVWVQEVFLYKLLDKHKDLENDAEDYALLECLGLTGVGWYVAFVDRRYTSYNS